MRARTPPEIVVLWGMIFSLWTQPVLAAPVTFPTALPVHKGEIMIWEQGLWTNFGKDPSPMHARMHLFALPSLVAYGPTARLTLFAEMPLLYKALRIAEPLGRTTRSATQLGDLNLMARFTAVSIDRPAATIRFAPFAGIKIPSGTLSRVGPPGRSLIGIQQGSRSWDPLLGAIFTWQTLRRELDLSARYEFRTEANNLKTGDQLELDASFQQRIIPWSELGAGVPRYLYAGVESNFIWRGRNRVFGAKDPNSGGTLLMIAPTLQWISGRNVISGAVQFPVEQHNNGIQLSMHPIFRVDIRRHF